MLLTLIFDVTVRIIWVCIRLSCTQHICVALYMCVSCVRSLCFVMVEGTRYVRVGAVHHSRRWIEIRRVERNG